MEKLYFPKIVINQYNPIFPIHKKHQKKKFKNGDGLKGKWDEWNIQNHNGMNDGFDNIFFIIIII